MKESVYRKLETLVERYEEVQALLSDPSVISDQNRFRTLSKEYSELEEVVKTFLAYQQAQEDLSMWITLWQWYAINGGTAFTSTRY